MSRHRQREHRAAVRPRARGPEPAGLDLGPVDEGLDAVDLATGREANFVANVHHSGCLGAAVARGIGWSGPEAGPR